MNSIKDLAKRKIEKLVEKFEQSVKSDYTEADTITHFFLPFLDALGWNIFDVYEVKQEGYPRNLRNALPVEYKPIDNPDCIISFNRRPYAVFEFKRLGLTNVDKYGRVPKLLQKAELLDGKYAVLSNFYQTIIYTIESKELIRFNKPHEYLSKFDELWRFLSKEVAS